AVDPDARFPQLFDRGYPASGLRRDYVIAEIRSDANEARGRVVPAEMIDVARERQIGQGVAVISQKRRFAAQIPLDRLQPLRDVRGRSGFCERDLPVVDVALHQLELLPTIRQDEIVREALVIVQEVVLDDVAAITETENEVLVPVMRVILHHVPQDWTITY